MNKKIILVSALTGLFATTAFAATVPTATGNSQYTKTSSTNVMGKKMQMKQMVGLDTFWAAPMVTYKVKLYNDNSFYQTYGVGIGYGVKLEAGQMWNSPQTPAFSYGFMEGVYTSFNWFGLYGGGAMSYQFTDNFSAGATLGIALGGGNDKGFIVGAFNPYIGLNINWTL